MYGDLWIVFLLAAPNYLLPQVQTTAAAASHLSTRLPLKHSWTATYQNPDIFSVDMAIQFGAYLFKYALTRTFLAVFLELMYRTLPKTRLSGPQALS